MSVVMGDVPVHERTRAFARGPEALADRELIALVLRNGAPDVSALDLAGDLLAEYGSLERLARARPDELAAKRGIGVAKAAALGRRTASARTMRQCHNLPRHPGAEMTSKRPERPKGNKSKRRRESAARRTDPAAASAPPGTPINYDWPGSRHGATAIRGFEFQHAVGAWFAAQIADGTLDGTLVPEGLDDLTIASAQSVNAQIKSRRVDLGPFPAADAARHIINAWVNSLAKTTRPELQWVVFEGTVDTAEALDDLHITLDQALATGSPLHGALLRRARQVLDDTEFEQLLARTAVLTLPWGEVDERTITHIAAVAPTVPRAGHQLISRALHVEVAGVSAANANPDAAQRQTRGRTELIRLIVSMTELIDVEGLHEALSSGTCTLFDWNVGTSTGDRFYEGESTQPGHVADGLVVARPDLLSQTVTGSRENRPVILSGPSGIGKSAVLWTIPRALPGVTWFRVDRVRDDDDANLMMRLARAFGATSEHPVGFLIDGAGAGQLLGWSHARARATNNDGVLLFATVRNEDLVQLGGLAGTTTIDVTLDEASAATIYNGLRRRGATTAPGWRESFAESHGLTLEFTYLLTQGKRLHEVIGDQITDRVRDQRHDELDLLALVAAAHHWGADLELERVAATLGAGTPTGLRTAISRLADEHLVVETDGILTGLHPVRSAAISNKIHATPPPLLVATFATVLRTVDDRQLPRLITAALRDHPDLDSTVIQIATADSTSPRRLAAYLQGLRLADAEQAMRQWAAILDEEGVKRANQPTVVMLGLARRDFGDSTPDTIRASLERMAAVPAGGQRDRLAELIGPAALVRRILDATPDDARALIATLHGWASQLTPVEDASERPLVQALKSAPLTELAETVSTFCEHDPALGAALIDQLGGEPAMLERIRTQVPWLVSAEIKQTAEGPIAVARLLHASDDQGDTREACVALARVLGRLLPSIVEPQVEGLWPGGHPIEVGGHALAHSRLQRQYDHADTAVAWNQARSSIAQVLLGGPDSVRVAVAEPVLAELRIWLRDLTNRWVRGEFPGTHDPGLLRRVLPLDEVGWAVPPARGQDDIDPAAIITTTKTSTFDVLSGAITNVTNLYVRLRDVANPAGEAMYVRDHVLKDLNRALSEPWHLIDDGNRAIESLHHLIATATDLADVLTSQAADTSHPVTIRRAATAGNVSQALRRAAEMARRLSEQAIDARCEVIANAISAAAPGCTINVRGAASGGGNRIVVLVEGLPLHRYAEFQPAIVDAVTGLNRNSDAFAILPTLNGKRFEQTGTRVILTPLPMLDVEGFEDFVPDVHPSGLASTIQVATQALQTLSGITDLDESAREHADVAAVADAASTRLAEAFQELANLDDELAREAAAHLAGLLERVGAEIDGTSNQTETYAAAIYRGISGHPSDELNTDGILRICALQWAVDEGPVRDLLGL